MKKTIVRGFSIAIINLLFTAKVFADTGVPAIAGIAPAIATNGATIIISGTNFSSSPASNIVYFGAVRATVLSASSASLQVVAPAGATFDPVTVTVNGLTAYSPRPFLPTFPGIGDGINASSFGQRQNLAAGNGPIQVVIADLDNDGKPDLIAANDYNNSISLYRNISTNHSLTSDSFAAPIDLVTPSGIYSPYGIAAADVDGDGQLDIIATDYIDGNVVSVYRNTCTSGNIMATDFATRVDFAVGPQPQGLAIADIDGDGRPDVVTANSGDGTISILRNTSTAGSLTTDSFAPKVDFTAGGACASVAVGDLDGDGQPDVVTANGVGSVSLLRNTSSAGNLAFDSKVDFATEAGTIHVKLVDLDNDGKLDVAVGCYIPQLLSLFRNVSITGGFNANSLESKVDFGLGGRGHTTAVGDLNGDGKPDLAVVSEIESLLAIFQNTSTAGSIAGNSLAERVDFSTGWNAWGVTIGDLDGDGVPDVVFANSYDNNISIYQNKSVVIGPPVITEQPADQSVAEGATATLSVVAKGISPLIYQWTFKGSVINGATNDSLTITNIHVSQAGNYAARVTSPYGTVTSSNALVTVTGRVKLIYNYSGNEKTTGGSNEVSYVFSGQMIYFPDATNGVFIGWATIGNKKQYWVTYFADYQLIQFTGKSKQVYTVLGKVGGANEENGAPNLWSFFHKGANTTLLIGTKKNYYFPSTFSGNDFLIYKHPQVDNMILRESNSTYNYSAQNTQNANNNGQTVNDLVTLQIKALEKQGYKPLTN